MRVSIIAEDNKIYIDKIGHDCDCRPLLTDNISAVQWYGDYGEVEFVGHKMPNMRIESLSGFQQLIDKATPTPIPFTDNAKLAEERAEQIRLINPETSGPFIPFVKEPANDT